MLSRLFQRAAVRPEAMPVHAPAGTVVYAIGDMHGRLDLLTRLRAMIVADADTRSATRKVVVYLGDYIDRGPESRGVIDLLIDKPLPGFESIHIKGNHEASLQYFLTNPEESTGWLNYGGDATLYSYGVRPPDPSKPEEMVAAQEAFAEALPPEHLDFYRSLKYLHIEGDYAFVHAGVRAHVPIEQQIPEDLMWIRDDFLLSPADFGKLVVHGHSITGLPEVRANRIGIDTGAYATGTLTCVVLEGTEHSFLAT
jgi:serine/threonine protein phosphatase 1